MTLSEALSSSPAASGPSTSSAVSVGEFRSAEIAARLDRLPPSLVQWQYCLIVQFTWAVVIAGGAYISFLYPYVWSSDFGHRQYSWLNALQVGAGVAVGAYVGGYLADRFGRKKILVIGALIAGAGVVGGAIVAPNFTGLVAMAAGQSIGVGLVSANSMLYMHEIVPPKFRGRMALGAQASTAIWSVLGFTVGFMLVPDHYRGYLYVIGLAAIVGGLALLVIPESPRWLESNGQSAAADRAVTKLERAVERRVGALPEPQWRESSAREPAATGSAPMREVFQGEILRRTVLLTAGWVLGYAGIVYGFTAYQSIFMEHYGFTAPQFFLVLMLLYGPGYASGTLVFAFFNGRFEPRSLVLFGSIIFAIAFGLIWYFSFVHQVNGMLYFGWTLAGAGSALWVFNMHNVTSMAFPIHVRSTAYGLAFGVGQIGAILGPIIVVALGDATRDQGFYGFLLFCAVAGGLVPGILIRMFAPKEAEEPSTQFASLPTGDSIPETVRIP